jgi:hypothetical protein
MNSRAVADIVRYRSRREAKATAHAAFAPPIAAGKGPIPREVDRPR